jgi:hypothetical protein
MIGYSSALLTQRGSRTHQRITPALPSRQHQAVASKDSVRAHAEARLSLLIAQFKFQVEFGTRCAIMGTVAS